MDHNIRLELNYTNKYNLNGLVGWMCHYNLFGLVINWVLLKK